MLRRWAVALGGWLLVWGTQTTDASMAVHHAYLHAGLPDDQYRPSFDLKAAGKLVDVLHHAEQALGLEHDLVTIADVIAFLEARE